jgi:antitoxin (DNA-binding transcriptional repressor) of toxin-antitoxin stability system
MTITVNIHEAKTQLSKLIQHALNGEEVVIAKGGMPVVKLTPLTTEGWKRPAPGLYEGRITILPNFDDPLDEFENL